MGCGDAGELWCRKVLVSFLVHRLALDTQDGLRTHLDPNAWSTFTTDLRRPLCATLPLSHQVHGSATQQ